jgi:hypothetical protein
MKTEKQVQIAIDSDESTIELDLVGLKITRVPVGSFAGTIERLFLTTNGDTEGFDAGSQGGGQN